MTMNPFKPSIGDPQELPLVKDINTHGMSIEFGKHKGERWTRVPVDYIRWIINSMDDCYTRRIAEAELERRGDTMPDGVEVSYHAIDKASLRARKAWHVDAKEEEGIYSWLVRISNEAVSENPGKEKINYKGLILVFAHGNNFPTLKTVMNDKRYAFKETSH